MNDLDKYLLDPKFVNWVKNPNKDLEDYWRAWIYENPDKREELLKAKALFKSINFKENSFDDKDKNNNWKKIDAVLNPNKVHRNFIPSFFVKIAAVLLIAVISGFAIFYIIIRFSFIDHTTYIIKEARWGQKLTVQLPDGTRVKLNSGSEIIYPSEFNDTIRSVVFKGEGYFEVTHDRQKPFEVISGNTVTRVLGTVFCINSYQADNIRVALVDGVVAVNAKNVPDKNVTLRPGQKATWNRTHFDVTLLDSISDLGWKENILVFNNSSISDITKKLERWYGVHVEVISPNAISDSFYGEFEDESLENVLKSIGYALEFQFQIENKNVTIKPSKVMHEP